MQKQPVLRREGVGPGKEARQAEMEWDAGRRRRWKRQMEGGHWRQVDGVVPDPTIAGSSGLTFWPPPPASSSEAAGDLGSVCNTKGDQALG